ncbi:hypothetical protein ACFQHO_23960 [Actinomadura yumaensis]|uniref:hypothetical protein n=2 Tax=Actinomadura TaxID=1988 RepID=UPI003623CE7B
MRYNRVIAAVALLGALGSSCTSEKPKDAFNPTPKPTRLGQVVTIAGDYKVRGEPRDGEYALRTSAYGDGGLAIGGDGTPYFGVLSGGDSRIAHVDSTGRLATWKLGNIPNQLDVQGDALWLMSSFSGLDLTRVSLKTLKQEVYVSWKSRLPGRLAVKSPSGRPIADDERSRLDRYWAGSRFVLRSDGVPVLVSKAGDLFEVAQHGELRQWHPSGYESALRKASGGKILDPTFATRDRSGGLILLGRRGLVRVPRDAGASGVAFPESTAKLPPWTGAAALNDGSILLLGGTTATGHTPRPTLEKPDGTMVRLDWGAPRSCAEFDGSLAVIGSAKPGESPSGRTEASS